MPHGMQYTFCGLIGTLREVGEERRRVGVEAFANAIAIALGGHSPSLSAMDKAGIPSPYSVCPVPHLL